MTSKKVVKPKFVCYDNGTPFRSEDTVIYGPIVQPSISDPMGKPQPSHYEVFICDCDSTVAADALVTILNKAWLAGKVLGETQNPNQKQEIKISDYTDYATFSEMINDENNKKDDKPAMDKNEDLQKFEEVIEKMSTLEVFGDKRQKDGKTEWEKM